LRRQLARWLRSKRTELGLSQRQLGEESDRYPWGFDPTWVSHWEHNGPREGFLKGLAYLDLIDADVDLILDLLRAPIEPPEEGLALDRATIEPMCRRMVDDQQLARGLGLALAALDRLETSGPATERAGVLLILGILAKRAELYSLSSWAAEAALASARGQRDERLAALAAVLAATVQTWQGYHTDALRLLDAIPGELRRSDASLDAAVLHARGFARLEAGRFAEASLDYREAIERYPAPQRTRLRGVLLGFVALAKARKGQRRDALAALDEALAANTTAENRFLSSTLDQTAGHVLLCCGRPGRAVEHLRRAERNWKDAQLVLRLLETRMLLLAAARSSGATALAEIVARSLRAPLRRQRVPERLRRLRLRIELQHPQG